MGCLKLSYYEQEEAFREKPGKKLRVLGKKGYSTEKRLDYFTGGMLMPGRSFSPNSHRYGFNGKEMINEVKGVGNWYDYGMRHYDPRIIRPPSVDPIARDYPELSPYQFFSNNPIWFIDLDGLEGVPADKKPDGTFTTALDASFIQAQPIRQIGPVMSLGGQIFEAPTRQSFGTIREPDNLTTFEMWLDAPSESFGEGALKVGANVGYSLVNSPFILATGQTIGGKEVTPQEKTEAFVDFVPGLLSGGLTKTGQVIKTTKKGLQGFNQFVKQAPDATITKGLPEGTKWQTRAGELFQQNKVSQGGLETGTRGTDIIGVGKEIKEEVEK